MIRIERRRNGLSEPEVRSVCNENVRQKNHWLELLPGENRWKNFVRDISSGAAKEISCPESDNKERQICRRNLWACLSLNKA